MATALVMGRHARFLVGTIGRALTNRFSAERRQDAAKNGADQ
jgi:hypothetical protein